MELNREQVIKALECCNKAIVADCVDCPLCDVDSCENSLLGNALSLINELTEERDGLENLIHTMSEIENRMSETIEELTSENKLLNVELGNANSEISRLIEERKELTEENERLKRTQVVQHIHIDEQFRKECEYEMKQLKADTVKKMQERLTSFFANDDTLKYIEVDAEYINEQIDHITEEILEEVTANGDKED